MGGAALQQGQLDAADLRAGGSGDDAGQTMGQAAQLAWPKPSVEEVLASETNAPSE